MVITTDPKLTGPKRVDSRPDTGARKPEDTSPGDRNPTVVGRDLQALRDLLHLHLADPRRNEGKITSPAISTRPAAQTVRQAAVKAASGRSLQLYICTPLDEDVDRPASQSEAGSADRRSYHFFGIRKAWRYFKRQRDLRRQRDQLMLMNDHMLRDIGIENRMEIAELMHDHRYAG
ncbi:DUF1127 domain-containing protein (plasmid) [Aliirhizobium terrae]|uniref:DUF1127 domain-containing protein n=1 Tax=Terrirhizobium terrae TaxID=2926709 RepID=UPI002578D93D|nr:DUF1127 domain-containing protein [Rhizobium sp. CC-CFT758]WJH38094.1 DUF1127 domain-containing protein [Rhizobium sp. CC-CFT758]